MTTTRSIPRHIKRRLAQTGVTYDQYCAARLAVGAHGISFHAADYHGYDASRWAKTGPQFIRVKLTVEAARDYILNPQSLIEEFERQEAEFAKQAPVSYDQKPLCCGCYCEPCSCLPDDCNVDPQ